MSVSHLTKLWPVQRARLQNSVWQQQRCNSFTVRGSLVACSDSSSERCYSGPAAAVTAGYAAHATPSAGSQPGLSPGVVEPHPSTAAASSLAPSKEAVLFRRRARDARRAGDPHLAYEVLQEGLQQHPGDAHLTVAAASAAARLGLAEEALQLISPLLQQQPNNPHVLAAAAAAYRARGDFVTARRCYESAAAAAPANEVILQAWGVLEAAAGHADAARALFKQSIALKPRHMPAYVAWAHMEGQAGNVQAARALHREAHDVNPLSVPNLHAWAQLEWSDGRWMIAVKLLELALQANRNHLPSWMAMGKARWMLGGAAAARQVFEAAINQLGPLPQLVQQWTTLEQQAQLIPAARAVLGFQETSLQQQDQQQQQAGVRRLRRSRPAQAQQQEQSMLPQQHENGSSGQADVGSDPGQAVQPQLQQLLMTLKAQTLGVAAGQGASNQGRAAQPGQGLQQQVEAQPQRRQQRQQQQAAAVAAGRYDHMVQQQGTERQPLAQQSQPLAAESALLHQQEEQVLQQEMTVSLQQSRVQPRSPAQQQPQQRLGSRGEARSSGSGDVSQPLTDKAVRGYACQPSRHVPSLVSAAVMEHRAGNVSKAQQLYEAALQLEPSNARLLHSMVQMYLKEGNRTAAEQYLDKLQAVDPGNGFLCHTRGLLAQQEGQLDEAMTWFTRGTQEQYARGALLCFEALAELQVFMGDVRAARVTIATVLRSRRPNGRFLRVCGLIEKRLGDLDAAASLLKRSVAVDPRDYKSWLALAVLERRTGDHSAAARAFQRGSACAPRNPHIWYLWGSMTWRELRDYRAARRLFERAVEYCPRNAPLWMEWAMMEWDAADSQDRARQLFAQGASVPLSYQHPPLYQAWAEREAAVGNEQSAEELRVRFRDVAKAVQRQGLRRQQAARQ